MTQERFYGRRVGRKSASRRAFIEENLKGFSLTPDTLSPSVPLENLFSHRVKKIALEIGFGAGEHLIQQLLNDPHLGMIGVEPFQDGMAHALKNAQAHASIEGRLKLVPEDIRLLLPLFPKEAFEKIFILFSDPWPKKRHQKRRLLQPPFLETCATLLKSGGQLLIAHDHIGYIEEIWRILNTQDTLIYREGLQSLNPPDWPSWPPHWPMTRYGKKALAQGRSLAFFVWEKPLTDV
jgi:tRNA (guanine-N7-)-methyltransferase